MLAETLHKGIFMNQAQCLTDWTGLVEFNGFVARLTATAIEKSGDTHVAA